MLCQGWVRLYTVDAIRCHYDLSEVCFGLLWFVCNLRKQNKLSRVSEKRHVRDNENFLMRQVPLLQRS